MANGGFDSGPGSSTGAQSGSVGMQAGTTLREEQTHIRSSRPVAMRRVTSNNEVTRDRVRWGPVWGGLVVTIATYILLQLALLATGLVDADAAGGVNEDAILSAIVGLIAFFVGGLVTGASAQWRNITDGALNAIVTWSLAVVALIMLAFVGGGFAAGSLGDVTEQFNIDTPTADEVEVDEAEATDAARDASGGALLGISAALLAMVLGGIAGAKMWPRKDDDHEVDLRDDYSGTDETLTRGRTSGL